MIGDGGMANVYLAHDMILDRDVAVKVLRLNFVNEDEFIRRFQREAQAATSLAHPNIVNIYDVGEEEHLYYIVMEYVDGMTLKQYIQQQHPIPIEKALDIMKQLTSAVAHAHQNQIVHRDIKPQNILIDHEGNVKITDFGIAMALSSTSITQTNAVLGSVHYLSPEQARGGMATKKSDIYSLGIVMFEMLTGRLPFSGESAVSIALKHLQSDTPSPTRWNPDLPQSVENIVLKATAKDPFMRYSDAEEMENDLETALDPDRVNEPKFFIPEDTDATRAIPVITNEHAHSPNGETAVHTNQETKQLEKAAPQKKKKKKKKWPWIIGSMIALILLAVVFIVAVLPAVLGSQNVEVPDVSGEKYDDAVLLLVEAGLEVGENIDTPSEEVPEGEVIKTYPRAGNKVKKGQSVNIYTSTGKERFKLDDYVGRQFDHIYELLDKEGFVDIKKNDKHDNAPEGQIIDQDPKPNENVIPEETIVSFVVSIGPEKIKLKDLRGLNRKGLENYEESTGILIDMNTEEYSDTVLEGLVISQSHEPGAELAKGDRVKVIISKGKEEIPPETAVRNIEIPYEPDEEGVPQEIRIHIEDMKNNLSVPADTFFIDKTEIRQLHFLIEKGKKAIYQVYRDDRLIEEKEVSRSDE